MPIHRLRERVFLASEEFGKECFGLTAEPIEDQFKRVWLSARKWSRKDGVNRLVGIETIVEE